jgi:4-diphosphocytidyl-2-C-methyl-D-erythritol kinase
MQRKRPAGKSRVVSARAFAKINLSLRVVGTRVDGYHELDTTFQSLRLHDTLKVVERPGAFEISCSDPACPTDSANLVWRAAERLWRLVDRRTPLSGVRVSITKRIPMQAGLGGGSSDAAAAMRVLAAWWGIDSRAPRVRRIAAELGADVPFFLLGGTVRGLSRGDVLRPMPDIAPPAWVVLVLPSFGVSTADAYRWWDEDRRREAAAAPASWMNDLEPPVARRHPQIARIAQALRRLGAWHAAMSGSGSAVFGLFASRAAASAAAAALAGRARRTLVTRTLDGASYRKAL